MVVLPRKEAVVVVFPLLLVAQDLVGLIDLDELLGVLSIFVSVRVVSFSQLVILPLDVFLGGPLVDLQSVVKIMVIEGHPPANTGGPETLSDNHF